MKKFFRDFKSWSGGMSLWIPLLFLILIFPVTYLTRNLSGGAVIFVWAFLGLGVAACISFYQSRK